MSTLIVWIDHSAIAFIGRAQVAAGLVAYTVCLLGIVYLTLPRSKVALWRYNNPLFDEWIVATVWCDMRLIHCFVPT